MVDALIILGYTFIVTYLATRGGGQYIAPLNIGLSILMLYYNRAIALGIPIVSSPLMAIYSTGFFQIAVYVPFIVCCFWLIARHKITAKGTAPLFLSILYVFLTYLGGYEADGVNMLLQMVCLLMFYVVFNMFSPHELPVIIWSYICCSLMIIAYIFTGGLDAFSGEGRLSFGEGSKTLAMVCAIPLAFVLYTTMSKKALFANYKSFFFRIVTIALIPILLMTIMATGARAVLLAFWVGIILNHFSQGGGVKKFIPLAAVILLAYVAFNFITELDIFRMERFLAFEEYSSGNGRTDIWSHYFNKMSEMGIETVLFGAGPGNIIRISNIGYYAHSTFLDYYFCYGLVGFAMLCICEYKSFKFMYDKNQLIPMIVVATIFICNTTHGSAANTGFFMLQALMMVNFKKTI